MQLGFIGLGRMGANMVRRLANDGHDIVAYNRTVEKAHELADEGARPATRSSADTSPSSSPSSPSRARSGSWSPRATRRRRRSRSSSTTWSRATPSSTAVTRTSTTTCAGTPMLAEHGIHYVDAGVSGGIWGLANGFCLMVGGEPEVVGPLEPIFKSLAPKDGYLHAGGRRRRPLREDGPQRHRVRPDAGVRRGLRDHARERIPTRPCRDLRPVEPRLGCPVVAARASNT